MGGGNGMKSQMAREKAQKKAAGGAGSQLKSTAAAQTIQCLICRNTFQSTTKLPQLQEHVNNKHPKNAPKDCFPSHF